MNSRAPLPSPVSRVLADALPPAVVDRMWRAQTLRRGQRARRRLTLIAAAVVALAIGSVGFGLGRSSTGTESVASAPALAPTVAPVAAAIARERLPEVIETTATSTRIELDEGSWIEATPGTRVETRIDDEREVRLALVQGRVEIEVQPGSLRRWVVESPLARVLVVGTRFSVALEDDDVAIAVSHGAVRVLSPWIDDAVAMVAAGEALVVRRSPTVETRARTSEPSRPRTAPLEAPPRAQPDDTNVDLLFREADELRRAGRSDDALVPLARILAARPDTADGALAAFTMARIYDELHDDGRARDSLTRARAIGLPSALETEARARLDALGAGRDEAVHAP